MGVSVILFTDRNNDILTARIPLTSEQIQTGNSIPIDAILAIGSDYFIEPVSAFLDFTAGDTPFVSSYMYLVTDGLTTPILRSPLDVLLSADDITPKFIEYVNLGSQLAANSNIQIMTDADSPTGNGSGVLYIDYKIRKKSA